MPSLRITNLPEFEAQMNVSMKNLSANVFNALVVEAQRLFAKIPDVVADSKEYAELQNDEELRGKLGMAAPGRGAGVDTDTSDLIKLLREYKTLISRSSGNRKMSIVFPDTNELEAKLLHNLSRVKKGAFIPGSTISWFRWWEFGDRGAIDSLTVTSRNTEVLTRGSGRITTSRGRILDVIKKLSRSGFALQAADLNADASSHIVGRGLIRRTYSNYLKIFPAQMAKALKRLARLDTKVLTARGVIR